MTTPHPQTRPAEARWYAVDKSGAATLCVDHRDAIEVARESNDLYPQHAPYTAVQLAPVQPPQPSGWRDIAPKGWKLVPVEPTNAMLNASLPSPILSWGAMLAAAPAHPAEQQEGDLRKAVQLMASLLKDGAWAEILSSDPDVAALEVEISRLVGEQQEGGEAKDVLDGREREHLAMGRALERACIDLPEFWEVRIDLERDAGTVYLIDPDGNESMMESGETFSDQINAAIDAAMTGGSK